MKKNTNRDLINGTSFHGQVIEATVADLRVVLGEPDYEQNDGSDKSNFDWSGVTADGEVFTVYDWKEYRSLPEHEVIEWHIGGHSMLATINAKLELEQILTQHINEKKHEQLY